MRQQGKGQRSRGGANVPARFDCADTDYHRWRTRPETVQGQTLEIASKPGILSSRALDPAASLLAQHLETGPSDHVCNLYCGNGLVGALAARRATLGRVWMSDRHLLAVEAARRTLAANDIPNAEVFFGTDVEGLPESAADVVVARLPQGKLPMLQLLRDAFRRLRRGGRFYLAGGNDEGIKTAFRHMEALFGGISLLGYGSGHRVAVAVRNDAAQDLPEELGLPLLDPAHFHRFPVTTRGGDYDVFSRPGVFSWDRLDRGTEALIELLAPSPGERVLEIGCGYGLIGMVVARLAPGARVLMVDADAEAVRSSLQSVDANALAGTCEVRASDVCSAVAERDFDLVVTNPPFHVGKATDLEVPAQFIRDAARVLQPGGRLLLVANRTLPYERWISTCFGEYRTAYDGREFKVLAAHKAC